MALSQGYLFVVVMFVIYYLLILIIEKRIVNDPKIIISRFLSMILFYAGISIIYFASTGEPFLGDSPDNYNLYIFIIGFIAILWTLPDLLSEFSFIRQFLVKLEINEERAEKGKKAKKSGVFK